VLTGCTGDVPALEALPLVWVLTGVLVAEVAEAAGAADVAGAAAVPGGAAAGGGAAVTGAAGRGCGCGRTWTVRRTTCVRTFGFVCAAAAAATGAGAGFELTAYPASPPRPRIVAPAAIFILMLLTIVRPLLSWNRSRRLSWWTGKGLGSRG
jgi:hypothetical protein